MNQPPLTNLHQHFKAAFDSGHFLGISEANQELESTKLKKISLSKVFDTAKEQISKELKGKNLEKYIIEINALKDDGEQFYKRYLVATKRWSRTFLKGLARITPEFMKRFLPSCFSNKMEEAEKKTKEAYEKYHTYLNETLSSIKDSKKQPENNTQNQNKTQNVNNIQKSKTSNSKNNPNDVQPKNLIKIEDLNHALNALSNPLSHPSQTPLPNPQANPNHIQSKNLIKIKDLNHALNALSIPLSPPSQNNNSSVDDDLLEDELMGDGTENIEDVDTADFSNDDTENQKKLIFQLLDRIEIQFKNLQNKTMSQQKFKFVLKNLIDQINQIQKLTSDTKNVLANKKISNETYDFLMNDQLSIIIRTAFCSNNHANLNQTLLNSPFKDNFQKAIDLENQGSIIFGYNKMRQYLELRKLANKIETKANENDFINYTGIVDLKITDELTPLEKLLDQIKSHDTCRPASVRINLLSQKLTPELFKLLLELYVFIPEIILNNVIGLDFKTLSLTKQKEEEFIKNLDMFFLPDVKEIILSKQTNSNLTARDYSNLLAICPNFKLLKECFQHCSSFQEIIIPTQLLNSKEMDFSGLSFDQILYLIKQCKNLEKINLGGALNDSQLSSIIKGNDKIRVLDLNQCSSITTDSLFFLTKLKNLSQLNLPNLPKGKKDLKKLPKYDNPFDINLFYTQSQETQKLASSLYSGPQHWAAAFQIPLARQGILEIFPANQLKLDHMSSAYWLAPLIKIKPDGKDQWEFENLEPQPQIISVIADFNANINDDNIVEFMKKFPNACSLKLCNCPHISYKGIISLLEARPNIKKIDLTGCYLIDDNLLSRSDLLSKLKKLTITDTKISKAKIPANLDKIVMIEETTLKIANDQLQHPDSLEEIFKKLKLNELKSIDFTDCTNLTDEMLGKVLDRLNVDKWFINNKSKTKNLQRLNLEILNLTGCNNITNKAFEISGKQTEVKLLESLNLIVKKGTKITEKLEQAYPEIIFQNTEKPMTIQIDPEAQLEACQQYFIQKQGDATAQQNLSKLAKNLIHHRIVVDIYRHQFQDQDSVNEILNQRIETQHDDFCDITLYFNTEETAKPTAIKAHKDLLYTQSSYFRKKLKPTIGLNKNIGLTLLNQNGSKQAVKVLLDQIYEKADLNSIGWLTAAEAAELTKIFKISKKHYQNLINKMMSLLDLNTADRLLLKATQLNDEEFKNKIEKKLITIAQACDIIDIVKNQSDINKLYNLAHTPDTYVLENLKQVITPIKDKLDQQIALSFHN